MIKNIFLFGIFFLIATFFFNQKGWLKITPEGKKKAIVLVLDGKKVIEKFLKIVEKSLE